MILRVVKGHLNLNRSFTLPQLLRGHDVIIIIRQVLDDGHLQFAVVERLAQFVFLLEGFLLFLECAVLHDILKEAGLVLVVLINDLFDWAYLMPISLRTWGFLAALAFLWLPWRAHEF